MSTTDFGDQHKSNLIFYVKIHVTVLCFQHASVVAHVQHISVKYQLHALGAGRVSSFLLFKKGRLTFIILKNKPTDTV